MTPSERNPIDGAPHSPEWQETLSAYVDGELSPDQAARVRERLETDGESRRLVDELTRISEAVRSLPRERAPDDLAPAVMHAAERRGGGDDPTPRDHRSNGHASGGFTLGRSPRGWMFAGAAIAASVLIMALNRNGGGPDMVAKQDAAADKPAASERSEPEAPEALRESNDRSSNEDLLTLEADSEEWGEDAERQPLDEASIAAPLESRAAEGEVNEEAPARGRALGLNRAWSASRLASELSADNEPVVVRVNLRREAFRNRMIDQVLGANGIQVEATPARFAGGRLARGGADTYSGYEVGDAEADYASDSDASNNARRGTGGRLAYEGAAGEGGYGGRESGQAREDRPASGTDGEPEEAEDDVEIVVMVAPESQVHGVLSDLSMDFLNCASIQVEPPPEASQAAGLGAPPLSTQKKMQVAESLSQYSRAAGPRQQQAVDAPQQATASGPKRANRAVSNAGGAKAYKVAPTAELADEQGRRRSQLNRLANQTYLYAQQEQAQQRGEQARVPPPAQPSEPDTPDEEQVPVVLIVQAEEEAAPPASAAPAASEEPQ